MKVAIRLRGCDDETYLEIVCTEADFELLQGISQLSKDRSSYQCQPKMEVERLEDESNTRE